MKKFDEFSEKLTEEEYRNNGRFHYSDISGYMRKGFSCLVCPEKEESESLTFGSLVDCILTQGMDAFNERYCIEADFPLSDNQKSVTNNLIQFGYGTIDEIPRQTILDVVNEANLYKNYKDDTKIDKIVNECGGYYRFLVENTGKIPVEYEMYQDAIDVSNAVISSPSGVFFEPPVKGVDLFHQLIFNGEIDGIPVTCMVDSLYVDHTKKRITIVDLKSTCANYEWEFTRSFLKYNYHVQARLYSTIIRQIMDSDPDYKDYELTGFIFVYVSRKNKKPIPWVFKENLAQGDIVIENEDGTKTMLRDFREPLHEMNEAKIKNLTIPMGISQTKTNDVLEHIKR